MEKIQVEGLFDDGNGFAILSKAIRKALRSGWTRAQAEEFGNKAKEGDYEALIQSVLEHFEEAD